MGKQGWMMGNGAGEVKVKVRVVHLLLMVFEDDKERNQCVWILLFDGPFCPYPPWPSLHVAIRLLFILTGEWGRWVGVD